MNTKSQNSNMLLAFLTLTGVIAIVALVGFFMLRKGPEIIQGQAEVTEYRVSSKVPGRILEFRVKEGQSVQAGDTLAILEAPDVQAKLEQARAAEAAAQAQNEKVPELFLSFPFFLGKIEYICPHKYNKTSFCHEEIRKHSYR